MAEYRFEWTWIVFSRCHRSKFIWSCLKMAQHFLLTKPLKVQRGIATSHEAKCWFWMPENMQIWKLRNLCKFKQFDILFPVPAFWKSCVILNVPKILQPLARYRTTSVSAYAYYIILTSFFDEKTSLFFSNFLCFLAFMSRKTWFEIAITLINYLYLPQKCLKDYKGLKFIYEGFVLFGRAY